MANERFLEFQEELSRRDRELLRCYRATPQALPVHRSKASELIVRGGKRAGKSVCVSTEFASRVTGIPIIGADGNPIPSRWPSATPDYPRIYWIIGWDTKHIGQTVFRLLFLPGQGGTYRVIKDEVTGQWRGYNRANPLDAKRVKESRLSEPLIPPRMLEGGFDEAFTWEEKKGNQFSSVRLTNGATIYAFPSSSRNPKQGDAVSGIWIDEDIQTPGHLKEWQDRFTDEEGWFMWSVWPHMKNEALLELLHRAEMDELTEEPQIQSFQLIMTDNPFLTEKGKRESLGRMGTDEEIQRRNRGELLIDSRSMYQFSSSMHQIQRPIEGQTRLYDHPEAHLYLEKMWLEMNGFPLTWTRYLSIDPSNTRTAVLSFVIPPKELDGVYIGNLAIAEWEIVARRVNAESLAQMCLDKIGTRRYEAFIMDQQAGRQTHAGRDDNTFQVYSQAFRKKKLLSRQTSYSFLPGCNIPQVRYRAVRELLLPQGENGLPSLLIVEERCPETKREFLRYMKKTENRGEGVDSVLDEPANPRLYDCMAAMEYGITHIEQMFIVGQAYVNPDVYQGIGSPLAARARKILEKQRGSEDGVVWLGSGDYTSETDTVSALY